MQVEPSLVHRGMRYITCCSAHYLTLSVLAGVAAWS